MTTENEINELNTQLEGQPYRLAMVDINDFALLEKNARYMKSETFTNLVDNVKKDGGLTSMPFCHLLPDGKYKVLSGNHRVMAAKQAGFKQVVVMFTDKEMTDSEEIAVQLSHNAISGEDDPLILAQLWSAIDNVGLKYYAGLDDKMLGELAKVDLSGLIEARLDYRTVSFLFLPEEVERIDDMLKAITPIINKDVMGARFVDFSRYIEAMRKVNAAFNVRNSATAFMVLLDMFEAHLTDLTEGWLGEDGLPKHKSWVPLASIFGTDMVPSEAAVVIKQAVDRMAGQLDLQASARWQTLEYMAAEQLAGPQED